MPVAEVLDTLWRSTAAGVLACPWACRHAVLQHCRRLICRHEPLLSGTTDADDKFPERITTYTVDGEDMTGVFSTDLTLAEVKTLRARQPNALRDPNYDGQFKVRRARGRTGRWVPEPNKLLSSAQPRGHHCKTE